jgi:TRAP-type C4-dicarboxylate transport system substrate-binding protein
MKKIHWEYTAVIGWVFIFLTLGLVETASAQQAKPLVLRVAHLSSALGTGPEYLKKAASEVERLTEGRIKLEIYWSESLVKVKEMPKAVQRGVCDIAWVASSYHPAEIPLWTHYRTFLYHPQGDDAGYLTRKAWELFDRSKPLRDDMERIGQTAWFCCPYDSYPLYSKKIVKTLEDMKGMRIRVTGEEPAKCVSAIGGHPTFIPAPETYSGLEKGIVDGAFAGWEWGKRYALYEVVPYVVDTRINMAYAFFNVSLSALKKMSEKDRKTFMEVGRRASIELGDAQMKEREDYKKFMIEKGTKLLPFSDEERKKWAEVPAVKALPKNWIERQNAAGRAGTAVMRDFLTVFEVPQWMPAGY